MKKSVHTSFMLAAALAISGIAAAQTAQLKLKKAARYEAVTETKATSSAEVMGQSMEMNANTINTTSYEVKDIRGKEMDMVKTLNKLAVNMSMMGQEMNYDSEKKDNNDEMAKTLGAKVGKPVNLTVGQDGKVIKSDAPKESEDAGMMTGFLQAAAVSEVDELLVPGALNRNLKTGDQWQDSTSTKTDKMSIKMSGVYQVKSIDNNQAVLVYNGIQTTTGTIEQQGMEMNTSGSNKVNSEIMVDMNTGLTMQRKTNITINMTIEAMGMSIPATGTVTTSTAVKAVQ